MTTLSRGLAGWCAEGDRVWLSWRASGMRSPGTATGRCFAAAGCKPAWITVAGFKLVVSFEECYLSVSKNILSWPPGETMAQQRKPQAGPQWPLCFKVQQTNWTWHFYVHCVFFQVILLLLEVPHLPIKSRTPWALCTCWRARGSPSGSLCAQGGALPKTASSPCKVLLVPAPHHALGSVLPHSWGCLTSGTSGSD